MIPLCAAGRVFDPAHPTCRSCTIGCDAKSAFDIAIRGKPTFDENGKKHGLPGRKKKQPKYRNRKVVVDGATFDSEKEYIRWIQLKTLELSGAINDLQRQIAFELAPSVVLSGRKKPALRYIADYVYIDKDGALVVEDCKSRITRKLSVYRMKTHLMKHLYDIDILES